MLCCATANAAVSDPLPVHCVVNVDLHDRLAPSVVNHASLSCVVFLWSHGQGCCCVMDRIPICSKEMCSLAGHHPVMLFAGMLGTNVKQKSRQLMITWSWCWTKRRLMYEASQHAAFQCPISWS